VEELETVEAYGIDTTLFLMELAVSKAVNVPNKDMESNLRLEG